MRPWHYVFLVEVGVEGMDHDEGVSAVLEDLEGITEGRRWCGWWINRVGG